MVGRKAEEKESELDPELKEISRYVDSSEDVAERSASSDSKESKKSGKNSVDRDNDPLFVPCCSRYIFVERYDLRTTMDENVYSYIISIVRETKMDYMITFKPYTDEVKNNVLNGLKKDLQGVTVLTSNEDSDNDGDLGGNPIGVRIGDDASPSTSKDAAGTSIDGDLHKCVAMLEEAVLDINRKKKKKKKWKKIRAKKKLEKKAATEEEEAEKEAAADEEEEEEAEEEKKAEKKATCEEKEEAEEEKEAEKEAAAVGVKQKK
ncbi:neurofilament medium polypeptide-like [Capsicum annuum]|uniref:neurofilament medium polypeptide-like n=1 Tax=Capsicum annuum TaxID=4072 RepID=UPI001FB16190|nr:neurofilament medium polypeptide-like [Capsicum annuum]